MFKFLCHMMILTAYSLSKRTNTEEIYISDLLTTYQYKLNIRLDFLPLYDNMFLLFKGWHAYIKYVGMKSQKWHMWYLAYETCATTYNSNYLNIL